MPLRQHITTPALSPRIREASALRSTRDADDSTRWWIKIQQLSGQVASLENAVRRQQQIIDRLRLRKGGAEGPVGLDNPCPQG